VITATRCQPSLFVAAAKRFTCVRTANIPIYQHTSRTAISAKSFTFATLAEGEY
jgi:hypothetical protein